MIKKSNFTFSVFAILMIAFTQDVYGAKLKKNPTPNCAIELTGEISSGDFDIFKTLAIEKQLNGKSDGGELENTVDEALCLNSNGGSYLEGRKIANYVHDNAIATRVLEGHECYSACAVIFIAGRIRGNESDYPARFMNVHAMLGFHAPYWTFKDDAIFSGKEVKALSELQHQLVADLIRFGLFSSIFSSRPDMSASLLMEMYDSKSNELAMVDTVDKAARWGIDIEGVEPKLILDKRQAVQLCLNFQAWSKDESAINAENASNVEFYNSQETKLVQYTYNGEQSNFLIVDTGGLATQYCEIETQSEPALTQQICLKDDFSGRHLGDCKEGAGFWVPSFYSFPPELLLSKLDLK